MASEVELVSSTRRHGIDVGVNGDCQWHVWAPHAQHVDLILLQDGEQHVVTMSDAGLGWFSVGQSAVRHGQRYRFRLNHHQEFPDPASWWQPDGVHGFSAVPLLSDFTWTDQSWRGCPVEEFVIYELHLGTFTPEGTLDAALPRVKELQELGITVIELMPINEFPGRRGWGYDGVYPFSVHRDYGGPQALQRFVDHCHSSGIAVLLDMVYNHLGPEGNYLSNFGPYFTDRYQTPWGAAWNFCDRESQPVRQYVLDNVRHWINQYHIDGFRLDAIHAMFDESPTHILREIQLTTDELSNSVNREIVVIAESDLNDTQIVRPPEKGGFGLAAQWSDDFHHSVHALLTGERQGYYADFGQPEHLVKALEQGFVYDGCHSHFRGRSHGTDSRGFAGSQFVACLQNHDQVGNRALGDRLSTLLSLPQQRLAAGLLLLSPYLPLIFMGEEYGEVNSFPYFCNFHDPALIEAVRRGRREEFAAFDWQDLVPDADDPRTMTDAVLSWHWPDGSSEARLRHWYRDLLATRRELTPLRDFHHRHAFWHPLPPTNSASAISGGQSIGSASGILELHRGLTAAHFIDTSELPAAVTAYFNFSSQTQRVPWNFKSHACHWQLLLSSEWPQYGGARHDESWVSEFPAQSEWQLLPYETLIFTNCNRRTA